MSALRVDPHTIDLKGLRLSWRGVRRQRDARGSRTLQASGRSAQSRYPDGAAGDRRKAPLRWNTFGSRRCAGRHQSSRDADHRREHPADYRAGAAGIPLSGRLNASYRGSSDDILVQDSFLALPHSQLTLSGSAGKRLDLELTSRDLNDLLAAADLKGPPPIVLDKGGQASFAGAIMGGLSYSPDRRSSRDEEGFSMEGRQFTAFAADLTASQNSAAVWNGTLSRGAMQARFDGNVGLHNWAAPPRSPVAVNASITNGDLADIWRCGPAPGRLFGGTLCRWRDPRNCGQPAWKRKRPSNQRRHCGRAVRSDRSSRRSHGPADHIPPHICSRVRAVSI